MHSDNNITSMIVEKIRHLALCRSHYDTALEQILFDYSQTTHFSLSTTQFLRSTEAVDSITVKNWHRSTLQHNPRSNNFFDAIFFQNHTPSTTLTLAALESKIRPHIINRHQHPWLPDWKRLSWLRSLVARRRRLEPDSCTSPAGGNNNAIGVDGTSRARKSRSGGSSSSTSTRAVRPSVRRF